MFPEHKATLGWAIVQVARAHRHRAQLMLQEMGLHTGQEFLLVTLDAMEEVRITTLSEKLGVQVPTASKMVGRLENEGFVERTSDPTDTRATLIRLSDTGKALIPRIQQVWQALEDTCMEGLSPAEALLLTRLLRQITLNLGDAPEGC